MLVKNRVTICSLVMSKMFDITRNNCIRDFSYNLNVYSDDSESARMRTKSSRVNRPNDMSRTDEMASRPHRSIAERNARKYPNENSSLICPTRVIVKVTWAESTFSGVIWNIIGVIKLGTMIERAMCLFHLIQSSWALYLQGALFKIFLIFKW